MSAGKSPRSPVRSQVPLHQPEVSTVSPVLASSSRIRSPFCRLRNSDDDVSPAMVKRERN